MHIEARRIYLKTQPQVQPDMEEAFMDEEGTDTAKAYNRLQDLRRDAEMSRREVAEDLDISQAVLANIERGQTEPGVMLAWTFAQYFGLPLETVFSDRPLPTLTEVLKSSCGCNARAEGSC